MYPYTPPEQITKWKYGIEEIAAQFEAMEQDAKKIIEAMKQFWGSVVQDEKLEQLTKKLQEAEGKLATLKAALRKMRPIIQITQSVELKEL